MGTDNTRRYLPQKYMIVSDRGNNIIDLILHEGSLESTRQEGLIYAPDGIFAIKRRAMLEGNIFWRDVDEVGDYKVKWQIMSPSDS